MVGSQENFPGIVRRPSNSQGEQRVIGKGNLNVGTTQNRRALSAINPNVLGGLPHPCVAQKKGALIEKNAVSNKRPPVPVHRPVTRKFAAQIASKKQPQHPKVRDLNAKVPNDRVIVDVENSKPGSDYPVPMSVQHTEALLQEIDEMDAEVEMKDIALEEESLEDIDCSNKNNPLEVVEYINDIYGFYKKSEISSSIPSDYMVQQFDINERMRSILIDWLIEVHYKFELMDETLYLTVNLIDRFLAVQTIVRKKLQLVGVTAMLLACKYEEVSVPVVEDLIVISDRAYNRKEVLDMESFMINTLQFNMSIPTPYVFMRRFLKAAQSDKKLEHLSFFIIELCLVEYEMLKFPPSLLAAAAIFTANCSLCGVKLWNKTCVKHTNYTEDQLLACSKLMVSFHQKAGIGKLTGVHRKYSTSKYGFAAKSVPALFLLEDDADFLMC